MVSLFESFNFPLTKSAFDFDRQIMSVTDSSFIGVDEAGRGPLAGPVTAGAVILNRENFPAHIRDSKKMSPQARKSAYEEIIRKAVAYAVVFVGEDEIDRINILQASLLAMRQAVSQLQSSLPILVDGNQLIPGLSNLQRTLVKGDDRSLSIGAASILAKVARDLYMAEMDRIYPAYGFAQHKGYPTAFHLERIRVHGPSKIHRKSFKGVLI